MIFVRDIQRAVAECHGLPVEIMWEPLGGGASGRERARPRQMAMALSARLTDKSWSHLGRLFHRDHSTIMAGVRVAEKRCCDDEPTRLAMRRITLDLVRR